MIISVSVFVASHNVSSSQHNSAAYDRVALARSGSGNGKQLVPVLFLRQLVFMFVFVFVLVFVFLPDTSYLYLLDHCVDLIVLLIIG